MIESVIERWHSHLRGELAGGVDIIRCNDESRIVEFRVMLRPLQAVNIVHDHMKAAIEAGATG